MRRSTRRSTLAVGLFCAGAIVAMAGLATMHFSAITVGVLAIVGGWIVAAGTGPDPHDRSSEGRDDVRV